MFDESNTEFTGQRAQLLSVPRTTINAQCTDPAIVTAIWSALGALGFRGGAVVIAARRACLGAGSPGRWVAIGLDTDGQICLDEMVRQWARAQPREAMGPLVYDGPSIVQLISTADHRWSCAPCDQFFVLLCRHRVPSPRVRWALPVPVRRWNPVCGDEVSAAGRQPGQHGFDGRDRSCWCDCSAAVGSATVGSARSGSW